MRQDNFVSRERELANISAPGSHTGRHPGAPPVTARKGTNPNYSYELYEFQYLLGIRRFVGTEMIKN